jgi:hypothetical protein
VGAEVGRPPVKRRTLGVRVTVGSRAGQAAGHLPREAAALLVSHDPRVGMGNPLDRVVTMGDDRPLATDAKVDPAAGIRLGGRAGRLGDDRLDRHNQPPALLGQSHRQRPSAALGDQPLQPAGVLLGPQPPDDGQDQVTPVGLQPHRPGGEPHPAAVAVAGLESGEPYPLAGAAAVLGIRPVVQGRHQVGDSRSVGLLGASWPPRGNLLLGLVPLAAQVIEAPPERRDGGVGRPRATQPSGTSNRWRLDISGSRRRWRRWCRRDRAASWRRSPPAARRASYRNTRT